MFNLCKTLSQRNKISMIDETKNLAHRELELKIISQVEPRWAQLKTSIRSQHRDESIWDWGLLHRDATKVETIVKPWFGFLPGILTVAMYCIADLQYCGNTVSIDYLPLFLAYKQSPGQPSLPWWWLTCDKERNTNLKHVYHMTLCHPKIQMHTKFRP